MITMINASFHVNTTERGQIVCLERATFLCLAHLPLVKTFICFSNPKMAHKIISPPSLIGCVIILNLSSEGWSKLNQQYLRSFPSHLFLSLLRGPHFNYYLGKDSCFLFVSLIYFVS